MKTAWNRALWIGAMLGLVALVYYGSPSPREALAATAKTEQDLSRTFVQVARRLKPSVVSIRSETIVDEGAGQTGLDPFSPDGMLRRFFGSGLEGATPTPRMPETLRRSGLGSGVIVSRDGYILTNNHVVAGADEVMVRLADDREFKARIVGTDPKTDLGVIKIDAKDLVPAVLGDSDHLEVGEWVLALGSPFGLHQTLTAGILSAKGRGSVGLVDYGDFLQTDAAINPGNSGGPLVDLNGEVVGINTAIFSRSGGSMGIGFAIPVKMARTVKDRIVAEGRVVRGYLGVLIQDLDVNLARTFGRSDAAGALVSEVTPDTPAAKAGLKAGDIIVELDGEPVTNSADLRMRVSGDRPGRDVRLVVFRNGERVSLTVKLAELPDDATEQPAAAESGADLGMDLHPMTRELARAYGYAPDAGDLVVTRVRPLTPADRAGIRPGDVLLEVGDRSVRSLADYRSAVRASDPSDGVRLRIRRGEENRYVFLKSEAD